MPQIKKSELIEAFGEMKIKDLAKMYKILGRVLSNKVKMEEYMKEVAAERFRDRQRMSNCH